MIGGGLAEEELAASEAEAAMEAIAMEAMEDLNRSIRALCSAKMSI